MKKFLALFFILFVFVGCFPTFLDTRVQKEVISGGYKYTVTSETAELNKPVAERSVNTLLVSSTRRITIVSSGTQRCEFRDTLVGGTQSAVVCPIPIVLTIQTQGTTNEGLTKR